MFGSVPCTGVRQIFSYPAGLSAYQHLISLAVGRYKCPPPTPNSVGVREVVCFCHNRCLLQQSPEV